MCIRNLAEILRLAPLGLFLVTLASANHARCQANELDWPERYQYRAFLLDSTSLSNDEELEGTKRLFQRAVTAGFNCCILAPSVNLIQPQKVGEQFLVRLRSLHDHANRLGLALIPGVFPFDSKDIVSSLAPDLAEGLPVRDVSCVAIEDKAYLCPDPPITLANPGFETVDQSGIRGWIVPGVQPGRSIEIDTGQAKYGNASLRFKTTGERATAFGYQAMQRVWLPPFRLFRFDAWIKSEDHVEGIRARLAVRSRGRYLGNLYCDSIEPSDWSHRDLVFNSLLGGETELWLSVIGVESKAHTIWFDSVGLEHVGSVGVLRAVQSSYATNVGADIGRSKTLNSSIRMYTRHCRKMVRASTPRYLC
jgi:hypothetical protein